MRSAFYEYYGLTEKEIDKLWKDGIIVFDTNVLVKLYQLTSEAQNEILSVMEGYKERIWMPHQVGYEYHEQRLDKSNVPIEALRGLTKKVEDFENTINRDYSTNPFVEYKKLESALKTFKSRIAKLSAEWLEKCPSPSFDDRVLESLTKLFEGKVGEEYDETRLAAIYKEGEDRYGKNIPPGYKDTGKLGGARHRFGDLIIWLQIIEQSKKVDKDVIFVTDDCKEDWWSTYKDDKLGPRRELIREFRKETGNHMIWFYTTRRFLEYAKTKKGASVKTKTLDEVKRQALDLTSLKNIGSLPGQISWSSLGLRHTLGIDESDPYGIARIAQTARMMSEAKDKFHVVEKPLAAWSADEESAAKTDTNIESKPIDEESKGE